MARGYVYEVATDPDELGCMDESDLYSLMDTEFDYVSNRRGEEAEMLIDQFKNWLASNFGCEVGCDEDGDYFIVSQEGREKHFANILEDVRNRIDTMSVSDFSNNTQAAWDLRNLIDDHCTGAIYAEYCFRTVDYFIRDAEPGRKYYLGHVCFMH